MRFVRAGIAALLIGLLAITPLRAVIEPGGHETIFAGTQTIRPMPVVLDDRTGLVAGIVVSQGRVDGVSNPAGNQRMLLVQWLGGACDDAAWMTFDRASAGYRLDVRTDSTGSCILIGIPRAILLRLRAPVDASTVALAETNY